MKKIYDEEDYKLLEAANAKPWQIELLELNPSYVGWGPGEDYMKSTPKPEEFAGWHHAVEFKSWKDFVWGLDELNICTNFYFKLEEREENVTAGLVLWMLHPRKGSSRGVTILSLEEEDLPQVFAYLKDAAEQNTNRFQAVIDKVK